MRSKALLLFLLPFLTGCVIYGNGYGRTGDVSIYWTLAGGSCASDPDVESIQIIVPGESFADGGIYPCSAGGVAGRTLHNMPAGTYEYTVRALGYSGEVLYSRSGTFTVNGDIDVDVDLLPGGTTTGNSFAYLSWFFEPNWASPDPSCEEATATTVRAYIDGLPYADYDCQQGWGGEIAQTVTIDPGVHDLVLVARTSGGFEIARTVTTFTTVAGDPRSYEVELLWNIGGAALEWELGLDDFTCAEAGVDYIEVDLWDLTDEVWVFGPGTEIVPCDTQPYYYDYLRQGDYEVFLWGYSDADELIYASDPDYPEVVSVTEAFWPISADLIPMDPAFVEASHSRSQTPRFLARVAGPAEPDARSGTETEQVVRPGGRGPIAR